MKKLFFLLFLSVCPFCNSQKTYFINEGKTDMFMAIAFKDKYYAPGRVMLYGWRKIPKEGKFLWEISSGETWFAFAVLTDKGLEQIDIEMKDIEVKKEKYKFPVHSAGFFYELRFQKGNDIKPEIVNSEFTVITPSFGLDGYDPAGTINFNLNPANAKKTGKIIKPLKNDDAKPIPQKYLKLKRRFQPWKY